MAASTPGFRAALEEGEQGWEVRPASPTTRATLVVYTPITGLKRQVIGVLTSQLDLQTTTSILKSVSEQTGRDVLLTMPDGRVLVQAGSLGLRGPAISCSARLFASVTSHSLSEPLRYTVGDQDHLAAVDAADRRIDWLVVTEATEAELLALAGQTWRLVLIGLASAIVLISVLAARVSARLTMRLRSLATAVHALEDGNARAPIARPDLGGRRDRHAGRGVREYARRR